MTISTRGVNYDVGSETVPGRPSRPHFDPDQMARELEIIATDLHCNAVRISGTDLTRLELTARRAHECGLGVWLSPVAHDLPARNVLELLEAASGLAHALQRDGADVVLVAGLESSAFIPGMLHGRTTFDRLRTLGSLPRLILSTARHGSFNTHLNRHLARAVEAARSHFTGPVTYASGLWEQVDWAPFDIVGVDAYRDARNEPRFVDLIRGYARHGKPVAALEFGCCTYLGAADRGGFGWSVVDPARPDAPTDPGIVRDEGEQAGYLTSVYHSLEAAGVEAAFPFTFASFSYPTLQDGPDLDVGAFGLVRCLEQSRGTTYPDVPWEPKQSFHALAALYAP